MFMTFWCRKSQIQLDPFLKTCNICFVWKRFLPYKKYSNLNFLYQFLAVSCHLVSYRMVFPLFSCLRVII